MAAVFCALIRAQDNMICSSWRGGRSVCRVHTKEDVHSRLMACESGFALVALHFPLAVQKHAHRVDWELLFVPRWEWAKNACASRPVTAGTASSTTRLLGSVVVNRWWDGWMDGLNFTYFQCSQSPLGSLHLWSNRDELQNTWDDALVPEGKERSSLQAVFKQSGPKLV